MTTRTRTTEPTEPTHPLVWLSRLGIPLVDVSDLGGSRPVVAAALAAQCGAPWRGFVQAPIHAQVVLTICAMQIEDGRSDMRANQMKLAAAAAYIHDGFACGAAMRSLMEPHLSDERLVAEIDERSKGNGFVNTALITNIDSARRFGGVFAAIEILWLRKVDPHAWAAVNCLGEKRHFVEAAGSMAHWLAERHAVAPIASPEVLPAIDALDRYMANHSASHHQGPNHAH